MTAGTFGLKRGLALMATVWPNLVVGPETVVQRVKLVREALADRTKNPVYIGAARGLGYRIVAPVTHVRQTDSAHPAALLERPSDESQNEQTSRTRGATTAAAVVAIALTALLASFEKRVTVAPQPTRVAILPFENLSRDRDDGFFAT